MHLYSTYSEEALMKLICQCDEELAFRELYRRNVRLLVHTAIRKTGLKSTAEDLVQETFVKFWLGRHKFDIQKNIQAYLNGMLKNNIINYFHQEQKKKTIAFHDDEEVLDNETSEYLEFNNLHEFYEQSLLKLPQKCREVFILSRKGYSLKEISASMQISEKTVEAHISKALKILRVEMKDYIAFAVLFLPAI
ncbi:MULTISPECIES: RNA polymerase sigma-70 factor [Dyadobacter]|uniref:RNA polymerase sigma-70 factor n=2 Tax=Dyadobacter TaxID=120831 RepID=A0A5R9KC18_9BACT|nr:MULTISPECIES: RNA polymerase sigma-70 factor [Dyadobacter]KAA6438270.1 RNA polymerase sigma-70 factor [Dyadobacter flavalbus]TLU92282.1 RNA polymerase sigma-70 factor [Dyadobacter sediminis]GGB95827.1 DNA-directed RNA polymerase sigma-70 factor [Dyadobacter sediminis]